MALRFRKLARSSQAMIATPDDLAEVPALDDALWVATAVTVDTLRLDKGFLTLLDADGDGRIRSDDVRGTIRWLLGVMSDR